MSRHLLVALVAGSLVFPPAVAGIAAQVGGGARGGGVQQVPIGTGQITVVVTAADTGRPLRNVLVNLTGMALVTMPGRGVRPGGPVGVPPEFRSGAAAAPAAQGRGASQTGAIPTINLRRTGFTDAEGHVLFDRLPPGRFLVGANRNYYLPASYGQKRAGRQGSPVSLNQGQRLNLKLPMTRTGVLTGAITDEDGEPVFNAQVRVMRFTWSNGFRRLVGGPGTSTDDRGTYRLTNLQPGDYVVAVIPNPGDLVQRERSAAEREALMAAIAKLPPGSGTGSGSMVGVAPIPPGMAEDSPGYTATYFPGTGSLGDATAITVGPGEEITANVPVQPLRTGTIRGTVGLPPGLTEAVRISLQHDDPATSALGLPSAGLQSDGMFVLQRVPPGQYTVMAFTTPVPQPQAPIVMNGVVTYQEPMPQPQPAQRLWGRAPVTVDSQSTATVFVQLQAGRTITGTIVSESATPLDFTRSKITVRADLAPTGEQFTGFTGPAPEAQADANGRFTLTSVSPGRYAIRLQGAPGSLKSAIVNGEDTLDFPLAIADQDVANVVLTLTDRVGALTGRLTEPNGAPGFDYTIVVASDDRRYWTPGSRRVLTTRPGIEGTYTVTNLPPGNYHVAAVTDLEPGGQYDPELLRSLVGSSVRVTIREGERHVQDLRVAAP